MQMPDGVVAQTRNCFHTVEGVLKEAGFALSDIVRVVYYVLDAKEADDVFTVSGEVLRHIRPAGTILVVAGLLKPEMRVEIEVTAKRHIP
jgi:enamine deaminase RidA (YjgF/YER057c/UK114 family)